MGESDRKGFHLIKIYCFIQGLILNKQGVLLKHRGYGKIKQRSKIHKRFLLKIKREP